MGQTQPMGRPQQLRDLMPLPSSAQLEDRSKKWGDQPRSSSLGDITREAVTAGKERGTGNQKTPGQGRTSSRGRSRTPANAGYALYCQNTGPGRNASSAAQAPPPEGFLSSLQSPVAFDIRSIAKDPDPDVPVTISVVQGWALYIQINIFKCLRAAGCFKIFLLWVPCVSDAS